MITSYCNLKFRSSLVKREKEMHSRLSSGCHYEVKSGVAFIYNLKEDAIIWYAGGSKMGIKIAEGVFGSVLEYIASQVASHRYFK